MDSMISELALRSLSTAAMVGGLLVAVPLAIGLLVGVFQSATQIQEPTLSFVPKMVGVALTILMAWGWIASQMTGLAEAAFTALGRW